MKTFFYFLAFVVLLTAGTFSFLVMADPGGKLRPNLVAKGTHASGQACKDRILMYSLTYCPACKWQRNQLQRAGIQFTELFADKQPQYRAELARKAQDAKLRSYGYPTLDIGGKLLVNPTIDQIKPLLCRDAWSERT